MLLKFILFLICYILQSIIIVVLSYVSNLTLWIIAFLLFFLGFFLIKKKRILLISEELCTIKQKDIIMVMSLMRFIPFVLSRIIGFFIPSVAKYSNLNFLSLVIIVPIIEEIAARKLLIDAISKKYNDKVALLSSSLIFTLLHGWGIKLIYIFLGGVALAYVYIKTKNIMVPIVLHSINNLSSYLVNYQQQELLGRILSILLPIVFLEFIVYKSKLEKKKIISWELEGYESRSID